MILCCDEMGFVKNNYSSNFSSLSLATVNKIRADWRFLFVNDLFQIPTDSERQRERVSRPLARRKRRYTRLTNTQSEPTRSGKPERERVTTKKTGSTYAATVCISIKAKTQTVAASRRLPQSETRGAI